MPKINILIGVFELLSQLMRWEKEYILLTLLLEYFNGPDNLSFSCEDFESFVLTRTRTGRQIRNTDERNGRAY